MKKCKKCKVEKEDVEFNKHYRSKDRLTSWCKICVRDNSKKDYEINKEVYRSRQHAIRKEKKDWFNSIKANLKCEQCGESHIATLDFHHTNPSEKEFGIARSSRSRENILKEIEKCIILCSNCHRKLHWEEREIL
jgi:hypothetical protein